MSNHPVVARPIAVVQGTRGVLATALTARGPRLVFAAATLLYLVAYLYAIGHLRAGLGGFDVTLVADPVGAFLRPALGPLSFTPIASLRLGPVTLLVSFNLVLGFGLAALVGLNLAVTALAWTQPKACGIAGRSAGVFAGLPALVSGTACCGPVVALVLGIQLSSALLMTVQWLVPLAAVLLLASLFWVGSQVRPVPP